MPDEQGPLKLPGAEFNEDLGVGAIPVGKSPSRGECLEYPNPVLKTEAVGNNLCRLSTPAERTGQNQVELQSKLSKTRCLELHSGAPFATEMSFSIGPCPLLAKLDGNSVPHQI